MQGTAAVGLRPQVVCSLLAHRRFVELLLEEGGLAVLLALPR